MSRITQLPIEIIYDVRFAGASIVGNDNNWNTSTFFGGGGGTSSGTGGGGGGAGGGGAGGGAGGPGSGTIRRCGESRSVGGGFGLTPGGTANVGTGDPGSTIAVVIPDPIKQFRDQNGRPLVNGLLFTYEAYTGLPCPVFRDAGLTTPWTNPVEFDTSGRATIFTDSTIYKFVLQTANGVTVWEADGVQGSVWSGAVAAWAFPTALADANGYGHQFEAIVNRAAYGMHELLAGTYVTSPLICPSGARVVSATTVEIAGEPTGGSVNYALHVPAGSVRIDSASFGAGQVATGGGVSATMGTVGTSGPATATQAGWTQVKTATGITVSVPYWV